MSIILEQTNLFAKTKNYKIKEWRSAEGDLFAITLSSKIGDINIAKIFANSPITIDYFKNNRKPSYKWQGIYIPNNYNATPEQIIRTATVYARNIDKFENKRVYDIDATKIFTQIFKEV